MTPKEPPKVLDRFLLTSFFFVCCIYLFLFIIISVFQPEIKSSTTKHVYTLVYNMMLVYMYSNYTMEKNEKKKFINKKTLNDVFERKHCRVGSSVMLQRSSPRTLTIYNEIYLTLYLYFLKPFEIKYKISFSTNS